MSLRITVSLNHFSLFSLNLFSLSALFPSVAVSENLHTDRQFFSALMHLHVNTLIQWFSNFIESHLLSNIWLLLEVCNINWVFLSCWWSCTYDSVNLTLFCELGTYCKNQSICSFSELFYVYMSYKIDLGHTKCWKVAITMWQSMPLGIAWMLLLWKIQHKKNYWLIIFMAESL